jgi:hypothetical protein
MRPCECLSPTVLSTSLVSCRLSCGSLYFPFVVLWLLGTILASSSSHIRVNFWLFPLPPFHIWFFVLVQWETFPFRCGSAVYLSTALGWFYCLLVHCRWWADHCWFVESCYSCRRLIGRFTFYVDHKVMPNYIHNKSHTFKSQHAEHTVSFRNTTWKFHCLWLNFGNLASWLQSNVVTFVNLRTRSRRLITRPLGTCLLRRLHS